MAAARFDEDLGRSERYPDFRPIYCALLAQVKRTSAAGFLPVWGHTDLEFFTGREVFTGSGQDHLLPLSVTTYRDRYYVRRGDNRRVLAEVVLDTANPLKAAEALAGLIEDWDTERTSSAPA